MGVGVTFTIDILDSNFRVVGRLNGNEIQDANIGQLDVQMVLQFKIKW